MWISITASPLVAGRGSWKSSTPAPAKPALGHVHRRRRRLFPSHQLPELRGCEPRHPLMHWMCNPCAPPSRLVFHASINKQRSFAGGRQHIAQVCKGRTGALITDVRYKKRLDLSSLLGFQNYAGSPYACATRVRSTRALRAREWPSSFLLRMMRERT